MTGSASLAGVRLSTAEIIAVGTELLTPFRSDTNSLFLTARLNELGIVVRRKSIVGDDAAALGPAVRDALARADLLVVCGGLGPTDDDRTRETVADVLGRTLREDASIVERLRVRFAARGWTMPENNRRQALVPAGAVVLDNPRGTAPGLWLETGDRVVVLLPGPPRELEPMFTAVARTRLSARAVPERLYPACAAGDGSRRVARRRDDTPCLRPVATGGAAGGNHRAGVAGARRAASVDPCRQSGRGGGRARCRHRRAGGGVGGPPLQHGRPVALGGGGRAAPERRLSGWRSGSPARGGSSSPGSWTFRGARVMSRPGVIAYSNEVKRTVLGVDPGPAEDPRRGQRSGCRGDGGGGRGRWAPPTSGIGVTGVAGPGGGSDEKPVGTVCFGVVGPASEREARTVRFPGDRAMIRRQATGAALDLLRRVLLRRKRKRATVRGGRSG